MWEDPIVSEVRRARRELEAECAGDFKQIYLRALATQKQFADNLVSHPKNVFSTTHTKVEVEAVSDKPSREAA